MANDYYYVKRQGRHFAVYERWEPLIREEELDDPRPDKLICIAVYRVGAEEVRRRLLGRVKVQRIRVFCKSCRKEFRKGAAETVHEGEGPDETLAEEALDPVEETLGPD